MTTDRTGIGQEIEAALGEVVAQVRALAAEEAGTGETQVPAP
jgi:hypothetical protein